MRYSDYSKDQIVSPMYEEIAKKLLSFAKDEETKRKVTRNTVRRWI